MPAESISRESVEQRLRALHEQFYIRDPDKTMAENMMERYHALRESFNHTCNRFKLGHLIVQDDLEEFKQELAMSAQVHANGALDELRNTIRAQAKKLDDQSILLVQQAMTIEGLSGVVRGCDEWFQQIREYVEQVHAREDEMLKRLDGMAAAVYDVRDTLNIHGERLKKLERDQDKLRKLSGPIPEIVDIEPNKIKKKRRA